MTQKKLYRVREVAEAWGLSRSKVFQMVASGEIESIRIGRSVRIPARVVEAVADGRAVAPSNDKAA